MAIKMKQNEILSKWKESNDQENKNIEIINERIKEEYDQIKYNSLKKG